MTNYRLERFTGEDETVGDAGNYGDPIGEDERPVPDGVGEPGLQEDVDDQDEQEDVRCVECESPTAVENPHTAIHRSFPPEPRCRICLKEHL